MYCGASSVARFDTATSWAPSSPFLPNWCQSWWPKWERRIRKLVSQQSAITSALQGEEEQFARTLDNGMAILEEALEQIADQSIPGDVIFKLYDTFGFPVDLTNDIARERGLSLDIEGYEAAMGLAAATITGSCRV